MANARPVLRSARATLLLVSLLCLTLSASSPAQKKYWVYFIDKGPSVASPSSSESRLTPRALHRREKTLPPGMLVDFQDLPLSSTYLQAIRDAGGVLANESRWMNAASFYLAPDLVDPVSRLPFVKRIAPVAAFGGHKEEQTGGKYAAPALPVSTSIDYGSSLAQVEAIHATLLHDLGITGSGVLVGMLDSGFRWRVHEALRTRHVIAEYDFIFKDSTTSNESPDTPDQDVHGTLTMSVLGGYMPGKLIGPAFNADFILAKTEDIRSETPVEEDNWAAGLEWMESRGVDVVSSSLGYDIFDGGSGYTWAHGDFNGRTSVTALAAARAARLGVVVCDAMGNEGNGDGVAGTMLTPADADSIVSVGAITFGEKLAGFSSTGPTNDGRTKPDVVTPGVQVFCARVPDSYWLQQGTSLATPLAAASAALVLSARPELTPVQVRDALRSTARPVVDSIRFPSSPNNFTGWGLVNAFDAALSFGPVFGNTPGIAVTHSESVVSSIVVSAKGIVPASVTLHYSGAIDRENASIGMTLDSAMFYPTSGRYRAIIPRQLHGTLVQFTINASDSAGNSYQSPAPSTRSVWHLRYGLGGVERDPLLPNLFSLAQNYPNPFNGRTIIEFDLPVADVADVRVYDLLGRQVAVLTHGFQQAGSGHTVLFDAGDLASGVYFYRLTTPRFVSTRKMMLVR
jgi:subtilisin family serine protease